MIRLLRIKFPQNVAQLSIASAGPLDESACETPSLLCYTNAVQFLHKCPLRNSDTPLRISARCVRKWSQASAGVRERITRGCMCYATGKYLAKTPVCCAELLKFSLLTAFCLAILRILVRRQAECPADTPPSEQRVNRWRQIV